MSSNLIPLKQMEKDKPVAESEPPLIITEANADVKELLRRHILSRRFSRQIIIP